MIGFPTSLPGLTTVRAGSFSVRPARVAWAAATVGYSPYGSAASRITSPLEIQWRTAMVRASLSRQGGHFRRSPSYRRLDASEKGALSFFLGQAQAKLFAHDFFRVSRFIHYDKYLEYKGIPRRKTRPDFIGFRSGGMAIAVEAKGRSDLWTQKLIDSAKKQVAALPPIAGYADPIRYAHVAYFNCGEWSARLVDPPPGRQSQETAGSDPALLTAAYYEPIVAAILNNGTEPETVELEDGKRYLRATYPSVDVRILVRLIPGPTALP